MSPIVKALTVIVVVLMLVLVAALAGARSLARRRSLRRRFGPEYDRVVSQYGSRRDGERELRGRQRRHAELELRALPAQARAGYAAAWEQIQARFVDAPTAAVGAADDLVTRLIAERGYPTGDVDALLAHLSVEHARPLGHYRDARAISQRVERGEAGTEQLRQALVHFRAIFADLLAEPAAARRPDSATPRHTGERSRDARPEPTP